MSTSFSAASAKKRVLSTLEAEARAITALGEKLGIRFFKAIQIIAVRRGKILTTGVGKSGFIAMKTASTLTSLGQPASFLNPLDALHGDSGLVGKGDVLVIFSASGSSAELVRLVKHFKKHFKLKIVSVTTREDSILGKLSDSVIAFSVVDEGCPLGLAPMASTTASLVIGDLIASALTSPKTFKPEHFAKYHPAGSLGLSLKKVSEVMRTGKHLPKVSENDVFEDVLKEITKKRNTQIVGVVNNKNFLTGAVADGDIRRMLIERGDLHGTPASKILNKNPRTIFATESLKVALDMMGQYKVTSLFVVDNKGRYIGFIHLHDIVNG